MCRLVCFCGSSKIGVPRLKSATWASEMIAHARVTSAPGSLTRRRGAPLCNQFYGGYGCLRWVDWGLRGRCPLPCCGLIRPQSPGISAVFMNSHITGRLVCSAGSFLRAAGVSITITESSDVMNSKMSVSSPVRGISFIFFNLLFSLDVDTVSQCWCNTTLV